jgi:hypothetical protein
VIHPLYRVRVAWGDYVRPTHFRVGRSTIGGTDEIFASDAWSIDFLGSDDDVTDDVKTAVLQRKLSADGTVDGRLDLTFNDPWPGKYNSRNPASPLTGLILPMRRCLVEVSFDAGGTWDSLFEGFLDDASSTPDWDASESKLSFRDGIVWSERKASSIVIPSTGATTVGAVLNLIHDAMGWPSGRRDFNTGSRLADFSADGTVSARQLIANLLAVDLGVYYCARSGYATYRDRYEYARRVSVGSFTDATASVPGVSLSTIYNRAMAQKTGGPMQTFTNIPSQDDYGSQDAATVTSPWFFDDSAALGNAAWRVITQAQPASPTWQFEPITEDTATLKSIILADIDDLATMHPPGLPADDQSIEWVVQNFGGGSAHRTSWRLRERALNPFIVGRSLVSGPAVVVPG